MSYQALHWAWEQDDLPGNEKFLLVALADGANDHGILWRGQKSLARRVGTNDRTVRENLKRLEERGLIRREPAFRDDGSRTTDTIYLALPAADRVSDEELGVSGDPPADVAGRIPEHRLSAAAPPGSGQPGVNHQEKLDEHQSISQSETEGIPSEMLADAEELLRQGRKVDRRKVTEREMMLAAQALAEFNRQAGSGYGLGAHLTPIVGRIRDRPSWDGAKHVRLVQSAFRLRWWERNGRNRRATPAVVYGERCFDNVVQDAADEAAGKSADRRGKFQRTAPVETQDED